MTYTQRPAKPNGKVLPSFVLALAFTFMAGCLGVALDDYDTPPDSPVVTDAQEAAMHVYMEELAVARACRFEHGEFLIRRTADGEFVCIPRKHIASK